MSYELIAIVLMGVALGLGHVVTLITVVRGFREMSHHSEEISRMQRAVAGLVARESEKLQQLVRS